MMKQRWGEVVLEDGSISTKYLGILNKWKNDFSSLLNATITDAGSNIGDF